MCPQAVAEQHLLRLLHDVPHLQHVHDLFADRSRRTAVKSATCVSTGAAAVAGVLLLCGRPHTQL